MLFKGEISDKGANHTAQASSKGIRLKRNSQIPHFPGVLLEMADFKEVPAKIAEIYQEGLQMKWLGSHRTRVYFVEKWITRLEIKFAFMQDVNYSVAPVGGATLVPIHIGNVGPKTSD